MQKAPRYEDVVTEVVEFLCERLACAENRVFTQRLLVDPFGFGKTLDHNLQLLRGFPVSKALGDPSWSGCRASA